MFANNVARIGFPWTMRAIAFMFLSLLIVANLTVRSRISPCPSPFVLQEFFRPLKEPAFVFNALASFFFFWGVFVPFNYIILEAQYFGMSAGLAGYMLAVLNATRYVSNRSLSSTLLMHLTVFLAGSFLAGSATTWAASMS